jgi:hypothetical protein
MEVKRLALLACALLLSLLLSCSQEAPRTQLIVVVDSNLEIPSELEEIEVVATGPKDARHEATAVLGADHESLPRFLALAYESGELGPITIQVRGKLSDDVVLSRAAEVSFVRGRSLVLPLHLARSCLNVRCPRDQTCTERGCESPTLDESELEEWSGEKPELEEQTKDAGDAPDAGPMDAGRRDAGGTDAGSEAGMSCSSERELCNGRDDNCNLQVDEGFDLSQDENNCGRCGNRCNTARGDMCCAGSCERNCN